METNLVRSESETPKVKPSAKKVTLQNIDGIDAETVRNLADTSETAEAMLLSFATRERHTNKTDFTRHKTALRREGFRIVDEDYENTMRLMQEIGAGSVVYPRGRSKKPPRFVWNVNMKAFARMAFDENLISVKLKEKDTLKQNRKAKVKPARRGRPRKQKQEAAAPSQYHVFYIHLSGNRVVEVKAPDDIDATEIGAVSTVLERQSKSI